MRLGHQHFNLANLAPGRLTPLRVQHISARLTFRIRARRQYHSHRGDYHARAQKQSGLPLPLTHCFGTGGEAVCEPVNSGDQLIKVHWFRQVSLIPRGERL